MTYAGRAWAAALIVCTASLAANKTAGLSPSTVQEIERAVKTEMSEHRIPAITVAVGEDAQLLWSQGFGVADLENNVPATASTAYRIASISKSITAVAAMQLVERGRLDLDAPIQRYVPTFPRKPWPITARQLLSHLSGIRHYRTPAEAGSTRHYTDMLEPLRIFADDALLSEPGTQYHYSSYGYCLLGAALEAAAGMRYTEFVRENIFLPAHMEHTRPDDSLAVIPNRARGYQRTSEGLIQNCTLADTSNKIPGGGFVSTASDLVQFASAVTRGHLVTPRTREQMFAPAHTNDGRLLPYGLGWIILDHNGHRWTGHSGGQPGASSFLLVAPSGDVAVALLANLDGVNLQGLALRIADILHGAVSHEH